MANDPLNNECIDTTSAALCEAEGLVGEVRRLLVHSEGALGDEGRTSQIEKLEQWLESYRRGITAAQKISANGQIFLTETRQRLSLALEEIQRLDDEGGGTSATKEQRQRMEDISRAIRRVDQVMFRLGEASFQAKDAKEKAFEPEATES